LAARRQTGGSPSDDREYGEKGAFLLADRKGWDVGLWEIKKRGKKKRIGRNLQGTVGSGDGSIILDFF